MSLPNPSMSFSPFAILTAAEMNDLVENIDALAGGTGLNTGVVTTDKLSTSSGEIAGPWQTWTPTYANLTVGNGTVVARYRKVGKMIEFRYSLTWGSTTTFTAGSNISISPPVSISSSYSLFTTLGLATYYDANGSIFTSIISYESTNSMRPFVTSTTGTYASIGQVNNTNPMTWTTGDIFSITGFYEAA